MFAFDKCRLIRCGTVLCVLLPSVGVLLAACTTDCDYVSIWKTEAATPPPGDMDCRYVVSGSGLCRFQSEGSLWVISPAFGGECRVMTNAYWVTTRETQECSEGCQSLPSVASMGFGNDGQETDFASRVCDRNG